MGQWVYEIEGKKRLSGAIHTQGSKNTVLPILAASILQQECVVLENCPDIADVRCMLQILSYLGAQIVRRGDVVQIDSRQIIHSDIPAELGRRMRSSVLLIGAMLGRMGEAAMDYPGGCVIGKRPVDLHIQAMRALGTEITEYEGRITAQCTHLQGGEYTFPKVSVGATENAILAAVSAEGSSVFRHCASEPEIVHLCEFLNQMGADIHLSGGNVWVNGDCRLHGCRYRIPGDRIAAGTYLFMGAAAGDELEISDAPYTEMQAVLDLYRKMGGQYEVNGGTLLLHRGSFGNPADTVRTAGYPGFPTDLQSPLLAVSATLPGTCRVEENIFEDRYRAVDQLRRMGAEITVDGKYACVCGGRLLGACVHAEDLRGAAALVIAGLAAEGTTVIYGIEHLERGYEDLSGMIQKLGGACRRVYASQNGLCIRHKT